MKRNGILHCCWSIGGTERRNTVADVRLWHQFKANMFFCDLHKWNIYYIILIYILGSRCKGHLAQNEMRINY